MSDFKFVVSSKLLFDAVETAGQVVLTNPTIPILENVLFGLDAGQLTLRASDLRSTMIQTLGVDAGPEQAGAIALPYKLLRDLLKALLEQAITIAIRGDQFTADVLTDNGAYHISGENAIDFPTLPTFRTRAAISINGGILAEAISSVAPCCSKDELRPAMTGMFWDFTPDGHEFVATDGHYLGRLRVRYADDETTPIWDDGSPIKIIVPHKPPGLIYPLLPANELVSVELTTNQLRLAIGTTVVYTLLIDERYPDYQHAIPDNQPIRVKVNRKDLVSTLSRVLVPMLIDKTTDGRIALAINAQLTVEAENLNYNHTARESLSCDHDGEDIRIGFDGRLTLDLLKLFSAPHINHVTIGLTSPRVAAIRPFETPTGGHDLLLLQMPLLLNPLKKQL